MSQNELRERIESRSAVVGIVGLGYIGLPLAHTLHEGGLRVLGFDRDDGKIKLLERGENYLHHLGDDLTRALGASDRFSATSDLSRLGEADVVLVCVPTPVGQHHEPDLSYVLTAAADIGRTLRSGQLIVLESTTYPGTTRDEFLPALLNSAEESGRGGLAFGRDLFVAFSPEREDPGRKTHSTRSIPKLVGGLDASSRDLAVALYRVGVEQVVAVSSAEVAESAKLLENVFRSVNIALVNELKLILSSMDIDVWEVIEAASTKPFGFMPFYPGPGLGGHCIPIDPFYLAWRARRAGHRTRFIELAGEINRRMPSHVVDRIAEALNEDGKPVKGSRILLIGLAYKADVDDVRETPAAEILSLLAARGGNVSYHDPHVPVFPDMRAYDFTMESQPLDEETIAAADCVVIVTDHSAVDYGLIAEKAKLVVDTRNVMAPLSRSHARVVKA